MSLFECLDRLNAALRGEGNIFPVQDDNEKQFINEIVAELTAAISQSAEIQGKNITTTREKIIRFLQVERSQVTHDLLNYISRDIKFILNQTGRVSIDIPFNTAFLPNTAVDQFLKTTRHFNLVMPPRLIAYHQLLNSRFCLQKIQQGQTSAIGISRGECYGIAKSMLHPNLSPYHGQVFVYTETAYNHQKYQLDRTKDQEEIHRRRVTREHFCPSVFEQAKRIYHHASQQTEKEFMLGLRSRRSGHSCYFSQQSNGKMRYMDPNHGAFLFDTQEQFVAAYQLLYADAPYQLYSIHQLMLNPSNAPENHSIQGKLRSLLTGTKYEPQTRLPVYHGLNTTIGTLVGGVMGAVIGSFFLPLLGTLIGATIGSFLGGLSAYKASRTAVNHGHFGLLGPYHLLRQWFYDRNKVQSDTPITTLQETLGLNSKASPCSSYTIMADHGLQREGIPASVSETEASAEPTTAVDAHSNLSKADLDCDEAKEATLSLG